MTASAEAKNEVQISVGNTDVKVSPDGKKLSISGDFNEVVLNGIVITVPGGTAFNKAPANDTAIAPVKALADFNKASPPEAGTLTKEGIYIGRFKGRDGVEKDWFADKNDAQDSNGKRLSLNFNKAAEYAKNSNALGHNDWGVPTGWNDKNGAPDVLNAMFNNKSTGAFKGTFDETGSDPSGWYRSSSSYICYDDYAKVQRLSDGNQDYGTLSDGLSVRLVRGLTI